jgi:hypothetical protein
LTCESTYSVKGFTYVIQPIIDGEICDERKECASKDGNEDSSVDIEEIYDKADKEKPRGKMSHDWECPPHPRVAKLGGNHFFYPRPIVGAESGGLNFEEVLGKNDPYRQSQNCSKNIETQAHEQEWVYPDGIFRDRKGRRLSRGRRERCVGTGEKLKLV